MSTDALDFGHRRRRRRRQPRWLVPALAGAAALAVVLLFVLRGPSIGLRAAENKVIRVVLPPPPPPPPPQPKEKPPEPEKPKIIDRPTPQPPPPKPEPQPMPQADDALTAREGTTGNNFGLAAGNGSGTRIGGKPGGDAFAAYANMVLADVRQAVQDNAQLSRGHYVVRLLLRITPDGVVREVSIDGSSGDSERDAAIRRLLASLTLSQAPPAGMSSVRLELNSRPTL